MNVDPAAILALISSLTAQNAQLQQENAQLAQQGEVSPSPRVVDDVNDDSVFLSFRSPSGSLILALNYDGTAVHGTGFTPEALREIVQA